MPVYETQREDIKQLKGVHLFHFATSNCSQRVRFVLEEKGVDWQGHHIDLTKCENATPEFVALNPRGVVPVLVHDGKTILESNDIIRYVDEHFPGPVLTPDSTPDRSYLEQSLERSSQFQDALKLLTHEFLFKPFRRMNERELSAYANGTQNDYLVRFMREFSSEQGFSHQRIMAALAQAEDLLQSLDSRLKTERWLTGRDFGLTDISWVVNLHRFEHMHYPLRSIARVKAWLQRVQARPAFASAISRFESKKMLAVFYGYSLIRRVRGTSVRHYLAR